MAFWGNGWGTPPFHMGAYGHWEDTLRIQFSSFLLYTVVEVLLCAIACVEHKDCTTLQEHSKKTSELRSSRQHFVLVQHLLPSTEARL
jgi:hypothetical protein